MDPKENSKHRSLLVIGNTGRGKSTWLNYLANDQLFEAAGSGKSCTTDVIGKLIQFDDLLMTLIDVPGLCDSGNNDQPNFNKLTNFLKNHPHGISSIAIVISSSDHRLDANIQKTIKLLYNFFGNGLFWYHVCVVVTHCPHDEEDIEDLKAEMTIGEDSLRSNMLEMIKSVCYMDVYPDIPFFFFDSKKPNRLPSRESLPELKKWLRKCPSFKTQDLELTDVEWQYKEMRYENITKQDTLKPIFKLIKGNPIMITVIERKPYTVKETREIEVTREIVETVTRDADIWDFLSFGISWLCRKNEFENRKTIKTKELREVDVIKYEEVPKKEFSGEFGQDQKELVGYYLELSTITESYTACWSYNCKEEDIRNKTNPIKMNSSFSDPIKSIDYYDKEMNILDPNAEHKAIEELKKIIES